MRRPRCRDPPRPAPTLPSFCLPHVLPLSLSSARALSGTGDSNILGRIEQLAKRCIPSLKALIRSLLFNDSHYVPNFAHMAQLK